MRSRLCRPVMSPQVQLDLFRRSHNEVTVAGTCDVGRICRRISRSDRVMARRFVHLPRPRSFTVTTPCDPDGSVSRYFVHRSAIPAAASSVPVIAGSVHYDYVGVLSHGPGRSRLASPFTEICPVMYR